MMRKISDAEAGRPLTSAVPALGQVIESPASGRFELFSWPQLETHNGVLADLVEKGLLGSKSEDQDDRFPIEYVILDLADPERYRSVRELRVGIWRRSQSCKRSASKRRAGSFSSNRISS